MPRVLLVDDDIAEISAVKRVLARAGHQPVLATNAADALAMIVQSVPAAVLVGASCENGEAVRRFGDAERARGVPIVVLGETPHAPEGAAQVARPIDPEQLTARLASAIAAGAASSLASPAGAGQRATPQPPQPPSPAATTRPAGSAAARPSRTTKADAPKARRRPAPAAPAPPWAEDFLSGADAALAALESGVGGTEAVLDIEHDPGLEAILRRAEEAERAHAAERKARARQTDRAVVEARQRAEAERLAVEKAARARAAEERAAEEARQRAEAERLAREKAARARAAEERAAQEARQRAEAERLADEKAARAREAEERAAKEARQRAEAERLAEEKTARARAAEERVRAEGLARAKERARAEAERKAREQAEARARAEAARFAAESEARQRAEEEARRAEEETRRAEEEMRRAEEEARRAAEIARREKLDRARAERHTRAEMEGELERLRRRAEEEARRREAGEEELRSAIASAHAELEALRRRSEEEARRRAEAEAEVARLAREAERKRAEAAAAATPLESPPQQPETGDDAADSAEDAARRRVAELRRAPADVSAETPSDDDAPRPPVTRAPIPELRAGALSDLPAPRLLALAARSEVTGRLDFEGEAARSLYLEQGRIVGATSSDPSERVDELALRLGLVTRDQYRLVAGAAGPLPTRRAAVLLLERGFVKPSELTALVRRHTEEVAFGVFGDAGARFRWAAAEVPPEERTALDRTTLQLAVEGVRRRWLAAQVDAVLGREATLLNPVPGGPTAADLGLSADERRAVGLADGLRTVDEIVSASPLDPLSTRQALAALVLVGALAVRTFQGGRPAAAATAAIDLARVREKLDQVRRADYFTILGVGRLCTPHEVREAFDRLRTEFEPRRFERVREEGLEGQLEEIQRVLADARDILAHERLREEYLRGLGP